MLTFVIGCRPEAIKVRPIILEAVARKRAFRVIATGQHTDLLQGTGVEPDLHLHVPGTNEPEGYVEQARKALESVPIVRNDVVIVQGDTASALAGALWAADRSLPLAHVEAGLRSFDLNDPWPEEGYRIRIDRLAAHRFCPTQGNLQNLQNENLTGVVVGNTIVDALRLMKIARQEPGTQFVLVTLHRRESFGEPMRQIVAGLCEFAEANPDMAFIWPIHPNPEVKKAIPLSTPPNLLLRPPMAYHGFVQFLAHAKAVLTDSGGVVEEACTLGVPTVIARNHTERPEALEHGTAVLIGTTTHGVRAGLQWAISASCEPSQVFGDGYASQRILDCL